MFHLGGARATASGEAVALESNRVDVGVGQAPRTDAEHGDGSSGRIVRVGKHVSPWQPAWLGPGSPCGQLATSARATPVRSVVANGTVPDASPEPNASGQPHVGG